MFEGKSIAVVVPAFDEETQIALVVKTMPDYVDHIIIVDDCSRDRTTTVVEALIPDHPRVTLLRHATNQGVGGAIATGYCWARDNAVDVAVVMAGDGQMDPSDLPNLLIPVVRGEVDFTKGNRLRYSEAYQLIPKTRYFGNQILSFLTKIASGYWHVTDSQSGYTAVNLKVLQTIDWSRMYKRYGQPNDLLVRLNVHDFRVRDVDIRPVYNVGERSGIRIRNVVFTISILLLKMFFFRLMEKYVKRDFHPLVLFYALGIILSGISFILLVRTFVVLIDIGKIPELNAIAMMFAMTSALQSFIFAMWLDMDYNKNLR